MTTLTEVDPVTREWIRCPADERAAANGARFDPERGAFVVWWIERFCQLYEGEWAGLHLILHGCHQCGTYDLPPAADFSTWEEARPTYLERARSYTECVASGHRIDWQYDCTMRIFGWVRWSEKWGRDVRRFRQGSIWVAKKNKKPLALDTPIPMSEGWKDMGDLIPGDTVFDERGQPCRVVGISPVYVDEPCYELEFSDGCKIVAGAGHEWLVESFSDRYRPRVRETEHLAGNFELRRKATGERWAFNHRIPTAGALDLPEAMLSVPPYALGAWLGDGDSDNARIVYSNKDKAILANVAASGVPVNVQPGSKKRDTHRAGLGRVYQKVGGTPTCGRGRTRSRRCRSA